MKILIIEDDINLNKMLVDFFTSKGYEVIKEVNGERGLDLYFKSSPDIVITDWVLPDLSGIELCTNIKRESNTPIIILTANSSVEDEVTGFLSGADDYITKPFSLKVLNLRVENLIKRSGLHKLSLSASLEISLDTMSIINGNLTTPLSIKEFSLLMFLYESRGYSSKEKILNHVWGYDYYGDPRTVDTHITRLRKKIGGNLIVNKRGVGYKLVRDNED